ncbi:MAG: HaeIII family restriction endonuclease [Bacteroidales bacterium]|nr:HaeIII family restriction endonuclease [Bacteroidales bacterium]
MPQGNQVRNGKAFEYALAQQYCDFINGNGAKAMIEENEAYRTAKGYYDDFAGSIQQRYDRAAFQTIDTMVRIEPGLLSARNEEDILHIKLMKDSAGESGDVRDVTFSRTKPVWEIGFSAKNNNDAVKHSRLSHVLDFGQEWLNIPCSTTYWDNIRPIFDLIQTLRDKGIPTWRAMGDDKQSRIYRPLLEAFRKELMSMNEDHNDVPARLVSYLIGEHPFYKIIKDDAHNLVIVKAFNINGQLNKTVNSQKARYKVPSISLPERIVEFKMKDKSDDTLNMILDGGWEISFRIHNASSALEKSLKFDIRLLGNPPILFTQHLFQD